MSDPSEPILDNIVWAALDGPQRELAVVSSVGAAIRFHPDVGMFCGVDRFDDAGWAGLRDLSERFGPVLLFRAEIPDAPEGWKTYMTETATQFVADDLATSPVEDFVVLGEADVADMVTLAKLTEPGPFNPRTIETGEYIGLRHNNDLIAMAGQRMRAGSWAEVSAVCVHPDHRRKGLAGALTLSVAQRIRSQGNEAFLHVREGNDPAMALYNKIGFRVRQVNRTAVLMFKPQG